MVTKKTMNEYAIRPGEAEEEYIYRIGLSKEAIGSWQDVADILNKNLGHEYTESKYRKQFQTFQRMLAANQKHLFDGTAYNDLEQKRLEYEKAAQRFRDQRSAYNSYVKSDARMENLHRALVASAEQLGDIRPLVPPEREVIVGQDELIVVLSDWHYGLCTENIWNRYDKQVFEERVSHLLRGVIDVAREVHPAKIHVMLLGDMCHGAIHTSSRVESEEMVSDQLMQVSEYLAQFIAQVADHTGHTLVYSTYGNHMRTIQNKKDSVHGDNFEKIIPWWLEARLAGRKDIEIVREPDLHEFIYCVVGGKRICAVHGDLDSVKSSGKTLNTVFSKRFGSGLDYLLLGDKHHIDGLSDTAIRAIGVGSLCGADDYASSKRLYDIPSQTVLQFRADGIVTTYTIEL